MTYRPRNIITNKTTSQNGDAGTTFSIRAPKKSAPAWASFINTLITVLGDLEQGQLLTLQVQSSREWVQFAPQGKTIRVECKSNHFRQDDEQLTVAQIVTLAAIGWKAPTGTPEAATPESDIDGSPNFFADLRVPLKVKDVTALVARTFAKVFAADHPSALVYEAFESDGDTLPLPQLGLKPLLVDADAPPNPKLPQKLLETIAEVTGIQDLCWDADGDAGPICIGTIEAFARVVEGGQYVRFYVPVTDAVEQTPELLTRMNELNCVYGHVHVCHLNGAIAVVSDVLVNPFNVNYVASGLGYFLQVADTFSIELLEEFGTKSTSTQQRLWH